MIQLHFQTEEITQQFLSTRTGETKMGQTVSYVSSLDELEKEPAKFVVFGISEDIGVQANYGKKGTSQAWNAFLNAFLNVQENAHNNGKDCILLGNIIVNPDFKITENTPREELGAIVTRIDKVVTQVVKAIVAANKIPIAIGGGHNNAFGMIKGTSTALNIPIGVLNIDAHTDLRSTDYRHSGNGFRYAIEHEPRLLQKYAIFGLHRNYTPNYIFEWMEEHADDINYLFFENIRTPLSDFKSLSKSIIHSDFGLEIDCDAIAHFSSSAMTPSGFNLNEIRNIISSNTLHLNCRYLHICEAIPKSKNPIFIGKALSYLVTDFIRNLREN